jgi:molecular chaperone GrpE
MIDPKKVKPASAEASAGRHHDPKQDSENRIQDSAKTDDLAKKVEEARKQDSEVRSPSSAEATEGKQESAKADDESKKKIEELTNHLARCMADLQNYKRRSEEDKVRFVKFANAELLKILLPALENLDRSCKHLPGSLKEDAWSKGVLHTQADLQRALSTIGVRRIETVGKKLDLKFHEVLMQGPGEKGVVTEELDPGYTINGETLKAAKVKVGDGSPTQL